MCFSEFLIYLIKRNSYKKTQAKSDNKNSKSTQLSTLKNSEHLEMSILISWST